LSGQSLPVHFDRRALHELPGSLDDLDLSGLDEAGQARNLLVDDVLLGLEDLRPIDFAGGANAPLLGSIDVIHHRRRLE
jgi:hypothetical protein